MAKLPTTYDHLFALYSGHQYPFWIPPELIKALAWGESRLNPKLIHGNMYGLMQVNTKTGGVLDDYNKIKRKGKAPVTKAMLLEPDHNIVVFVWYAKVISNLLEVNIPMEVDWNNPEWVKLWLMGWNAGPYGLLKVVRCLKQRKLPVNHINVYMHAKSCGGNWALQSLDKFNWQDSVQKLYVELRSKHPIATLAPAPAAAANGSAGAFALLVLLWIALEG